MAGGVDDAVLVVVVGWWEHWDLIYVLWLINHGGINIVENQFLMCLKDIDK